MIEKYEIAKNWLPRYTGMPLGKFGNYILLTNFDHYMKSFAREFDCRIYGKNKPMQAATNSDGLTMINFGIGSSNVATIMDLLTVIKPKGVLFLGKCGGLKKIIRNRSLHSSKRRYQGRRYQRRLLPLCRTGATFI